MAGMTLQISLTPEQVAEIARLVAAQMPAKPADRCAAMIERYGEACTISQACAAMNVSRTTLYRMTSDGRLRMTCDGKRVDVRSMAAYMDGG